MPWDQPWGGAQQQSGWDKPWGQTPVPAPAPPAAKPGQVDIGSFPTADKLGFLGKLNVGLTAPFYTLLNAPREAIQNPGKPSFAFQVLSDPRYTLTQKLGAITEGYDPFGKTTTDLMKQQGGVYGQIGQAYQEHPLIPVLASFALNWRNPFYKAGDVLGAVTSMAGKIPAVSKSLNYLTGPLQRPFNRFYDYAQRYGQRATGIVRAGITRMSGNAGAKAFDDTMNLFSSRGKTGLLQGTKAAALEGVPLPVQRAIILESQGRPYQTVLGDVALPNGWTVSTVQQRGKDLRNLVDNVSNAKLKLGILEPDEVHSNYFPMKGAYVKEPQATGYAYPYSSSTGLRISAGTASKAKIYHDLFESIASKNLRPEWSPAASFESWARKSYSDIAKARTANLLRKEGAGMTTVPYLYGGKEYSDMAEIQRLIGRQSRGAVREDAKLARSSIAVQLQGSLRDARRFIRQAKGDPDAEAAAATNLRTVKAQARNQLDQISKGTKAQAKQLADIFKASIKPQVPEGWELIKGLGRTFENTAVDPVLMNVFRTAEAPPKESQGVLKLFDTLNKWARVQIISNPTIHGVFNLGMGYVAAGGDISKLAEDPSEDLVKDAEMHGAWQRFGPTSMGWQHVGAGGLQPSEAEAQSMARLMTAPPSELTKGERFNKAGSALWHANQQLVFDGFEKRYATWLWKTFVDRGMDKFEAGAKVRQALGDYANIQQQGGNLDAVLSRVFFFYPWMKTVVPFWLKSLGSTTGQQMLNAPISALSTWNSQMGNRNDPRLGGQAFRALTPSQNVYTLPHPGRVLELLSGDPKRISNYFLGHLNPELGLAFDSAFTALNPTANRPLTDLSGDFHTIYDKLAPPEKQRLQAATAAGSALAPAVANIFRFAQGFDHKDISALLSVFPGGFEYKPETPSVQKTIHKLRLKEAFLVAHLRKVGQAKAAAQVYDSYEKIIDQLAKQ